jgi:hypothetical protein
MESKSLTFLLILVPGVLRREPKVGLSVEGEKLSYESPINVMTFNLNVKIIMLPTLIVGLIYGALAAHSA